MYYCYLKFFKYIFIKSLFLRYVRILGFLELNKYVMVIDILNSLDLNRRSNYEFLGGGRLLLECVLIRSSFKFLRRFLVFCCILFLVILEFNFV